ncbi:MAG: aminotransferase class I/II-fold pyridoxal phosphate-dependent enzyme, partial [Candidatus Eremiobacteraeota bacterium]|nr:aminotransferase class I/II-fold pyridoxal phosphate-dependent enzyme [Candidatus Eremiobacteraeota bacterium]
RLPFNVTRASVVAALAALDDKEFVERSVRVNGEGRAFLTDRFARLGLFAYPSAANFLAVGVPISADDAARDLLLRGIAVRSAENLGLPGFLRITVGTPEQNRLLIHVLEELLVEWRIPAGGKN